MGKLDLFERFRQWIAGIGWDLFIWGPGRTLGDQLQEVETGWHDVNIQKVANGFIVQVGCKTLVFESKTAMHKANDFTQEEYWSQIYEQEKAYRESPEEFGEAT